MTHSSLSATDARIGGLLRLQVLLEGSDATLDSLRAYLVERLESIYPLDYHVYRRRWEQLAAGDVPGDAHWPRLNYLEWRRAVDTLAEDVRLAETTGEEFGSFVDAAQAIREVFEAEGWTEEEAAIADGPTSTATRCFKDTTIAAVSVNWGPADEANCPADQPIIDCDVQPGQQNFTISIELVQIA